jgi:hypothetical protein
MISSLSKPSSRNSKKHTKPSVFCPKTKTHIAEAAARALATLLASLLDPNVAKRRGSTARKYHQQSQLYMVLGEIGRLLRALIPTRQMSESQCFSNFEVNITSRYSMKQAALLVHLDQVQVLLLKIEILTD